MNHASRGLFTFAQEIVPRLLDAVPTSPHPPTLLISGATASLRGSVNWSTIAPAKAASRILGQSIAREFGPKGIHVAHSILDGGIDVPADEHAGGNDATPDGKISPYGVSFMHEHHEDLGLMSDRSLKRISTYTRNTSQRGRKKLIFGHSMRNFKSLSLANSILIIMFMKSSQRMVFRNVIFMLDVQMPTSNLPCT